MVLPTGAIALSQVNTELGRPVSQAINLNDSAVRNLAGQTSGYVDMNNLRGKSAVVPLAASIPHNDTAAAQSFADYSRMIYYFSSDGWIYLNNNDAGYNRYHQWRTGRQVSSDYELYATLVSGTLDNTTYVGFWRQLHQDCPYQVTDFTDSDGAVQAGMNFQIRPFGGGAVLAYADVTIRANRGGLV